MAGLASQLSLNQTQELIARLGRFGLTLERAIEVMRDADVAAEWVKAYPTKVRVDTDLPTFKVTVNYDLDLAAMIKVGKYDWVNESITDKNFPIKGRKGTAEVELVLVHLDRDATTGQVEAELETRGFRAATIQELLALGAAHPELQRDFPIVVLGSSCVLDDREYVPVLVEEDGKREHDLRDYLGYEWSDCYRFLAVRK